MLLDRNDVRSHLWAHTWPHRAVASATSASMWSAAPSCATIQLPADFPGFRWKMFLLRASRRNAQRATFRGLGH